MVDGLFIDPTKAAPLLMSFLHLIPLVENMQTACSIAGLDIFRETLIAFVTTSKNTGKPIKITIISLYWTSIYFAVV